MLRYFDLIVKIKLMNDSILVKNFARTIDQRDGPGIPPTQQIALPPKFYFRDSTPTNFTGLEKGYHWYINNRDRLVDGRRV